MAVTVKELRDFLNLPGLGHDSDTLQIYVSDGGFPATPSVQIKSFGIGMDWDHGKLLLYPEKPLSAKKKKEKKNG